MIWFSFAHVQCSFSLISIHILPLSFLFRCQQPPFEDQCQWNYYSYWLRYVGRSRILVHIFYILAEHTSLDRYCILVRFVCWFNLQLRLYDKQYFLRMFRVKERNSTKWSINEEMVQLHQIEGKSLLWVQFIVGSTTLLPSFTIAYTCISVHFFSLFFLLRLIFLHSFAAAVLYTLFSP